MGRDALIEFIEIDEVRAGRAATILPQAKRTPGAKLRLASRIIAAAAKGERDLVQLSNSCALGARRS
jgi:hypothetical protein